MQLRYFFIVGFLFEIGLHSLFSAGDRPQLSVFLNAPFRVVARLPEGTVKGDPVSVAFRFGKDAVTVKYQRF
jgi:hypothetical protein